MKSKNTTHWVLDSSESECIGEAMLTDLELNLILGGYEPGYQESNPNANGWDLRGSSSGGGGAEGAGGQGGEHYPGSDPGGGAGGAGGGPTPAPHEPYPPPPEPAQAWDTLLINYINRIVPSAADGSQLLRIPIMLDVVIPPRPTA